MGEGSVLQRKLQGHGQTTSGEGPARLWRTAFGRAARDLIGLALTFDEPQDHRRSQAEVLEHIPDRALLMVIEGPKQELGLVAISSDLASAILEQQTIGRVSKNAPPTRRATRTDAALSARLIDMALGHFGSALAATEETWAEDFLYASFLDEPRALGLLLEDIPYRVLTCTAFISGTNRQSELQLVLPYEAKKPMGLPDSAPQAEKAAWQSSLTSAVMGTSLSLTAVLARVQMSLAQLKSLKAGSEIGLLGARLEDIQLMAPGNVLIAKARLGQTNGMRTLKITESQTTSQQPEKADFYEPGLPELKDQAPILAKTA